MIYVLYFIHVVCCLFLILVVLLQQGKGADLSVFGGGSTQAAFGARSAATLLHKATVGFFVLFILTTLTIGILQRGAGSSSIMSGLDLETSQADELPDTVDVGEGVEIVDSEDAAESEEPPEPTLPDDRD